MKQNEVKSFKILQDRSKTNIFVSNCVGGEKRKKTKLRFFWNKAKKNEYNRSAIIEDLPLPTWKGPQAAGSSNPPHPGRSKQILPGAHGPWGSSTCFFGGPGVSVNRH
jgi:hypothetical protein